MPTTAAERARAAAPAAAFVVAILGLLGGQAPAAAPGRTLAVTIDDLPATPSSDLAEMGRITDGLLSVLRRHEVAAVAFVNEIKLEPKAERAGRTALLRAWLEAGHDLGNHTYSHPDLQTTPLAEYQQDVLKGEAATRELLAARGRKPAWFRHPFTHTGPTREVREGFERFLAEHGYKIAPFSIENADYIFESARQAAVGRNDPAEAARLRATYVDYSLAVTAQMEGLARDTFGREIPQVLLIHANRLNVEALDEMLSRLHERGYRFVPLEAALADAAWHTPDLWVGARGPSWLYRFRVAKGLPLRLEGEPDPPAWVLERYRAAQAR